MMISNKRHNNLITRLVSLMLILLVLLSTACSNDMSEQVSSSSNTNEKLSQVVETDVLSVNDLSGVYVGNQGSVFILHQDGTGDTYWIGWDKIISDDIDWSYSDELLRLKSSKYKASILASYKKETLYDPTVFSSKNFLTWEDETFSKIDVDSVSTTDECREYIKQTFGDCCKTIELSGIDIKLPPFYLISENTENSYYFGDMATLFIERSQAKETATIEWIEAYCDRQTTEYITIDSTSIINSNKECLFAKTYSGKYIHDNTAAWVAAIYNDSDHSFFIVTQEADETYFNAEADFNDVVYEIIDAVSASIDKNTSNTDSKVNKEDSISSKNTNSEKESKKSESNNESESNPLDKVRTWVLNTNTGVYHYPECRYAKSTKAENKKEYTCTKSEMDQKGYRLCDYCADR